MGKVLCVFFKQKRSLTLQSLANGTVTEGSLVLFRDKPKIKGGRVGREARQCFQTEYLLANSSGKYKMIIPELRCLGFLSCSYIYPADPPALRRAKDDRKEKVEYSVACGVYGGREDLEFLSFSRHIEP